MSILTSRLILRSILSVLFAVPLFLTFGCTDVVTFANRSREEGMRAFQEKSYTDAAGAFRNAIRQDPRDSYSQFYLGVCYDELRQHQQAFAQYRAAIQVLKQNREHRHDPDFYQMVMDTYASSVAKYDEGEVELGGIEQKARAAQVSEDWFILAKVYRLRGDADRALDAYRRAARWDTDDYYVRKELGLYLLEPLNQTKDAEYWLRQAYRLEPNDDAINAGLKKLGVTPQPAYKAREASSSGGNGSRGIGRDVGPVQSNAN